MRNRYLNILQMVTTSLMDKHGNWLDNPIGFIEENGTNESSIKRLKNIIKIILESPNISEYTKRFIKSEHTNVKQLIAELDDENRSKVIEPRTEIIGSGYTKVTNSLRKDSELIAKFIDYSDLFDCINNRLNSYAGIDVGIAEFVSKFGTSCNERNNLQLSISTSRKEKNSYCGNPEFFIKLEKLRPYLATIKEEVEKDINNDFEFIGYLNYLLSLAPIVEDNRASADREILIKFLGGGDIHSDILDLK